MADATHRRRGPESVAGDNYDSAIKIGSDDDMMPPVSEMEKNKTEAKEDESKQIPTTDDHGSLPATSSVAPSTDIQSDGAGKTGENSQKNKEKEERLRLVREKQQEELKRRMEGLREATSRSEEFRKRLEEDRKRRVERLRQTEEEHRATVENRRKRILEEENERRLALIQKTMQRDVKLEQVKPKKNMATPPNALPAGTLSDGTISSGGRSPSRQRRPHSVAGRLPSYASPTVASQCRMARGLEKTFAGNLTVCYRCRSAPPDLRVKGSDSAATRPSRPTVKIGLEPVTRDTDAVIEVNLINIQKSQLPSKPTSVPAKIPATVSTNSVTNKTKSHSKALTASKSSPFDGTKSKYIVDTQTKEVLLAKFPFAGKPVSASKSQQAVSGNTDGTKSKGVTELHAKSSPASKLALAEGARSKYIIDSQTKEVGAQKTSTTDVKQTNGFAVPPKTSHGLHKKEPTAVKEHPAIHEQVALTAVDQSTKVTSSAVKQEVLQPTPAGAGPKDSKRPADRTVAVDQLTKVTSSAVKEEVLPTPTGAGPKDSKRPADRTVAVDLLTKVSGSEVKHEVQPTPALVGPKDSKKPADRTSLRLKKSPTDAKSAALSSPSRAPAHETSSKIPSSTMHAKDVSPTKPPSAKTPTLPLSKKAVSAPQAKPPPKVPQALQTKDMGDGENAARPPVAPKESADTHGAKARNGSKTKPGKESPGGKAKATANGDAPKSMPGSVGGEDEYKAKLTEKRRLARERAVIDAAQEKQMKEEALKKRKEEEEERQKEEKQKKLERQKEEEERKLERQKEEEERKHRLEEAKRARKKEEEERKERREQSKQKEERIDQKHEMNFEKDGSEVVARQSSRQNSTEKMLEKSVEKRDERSEMKLKEEMESRDKERSEKVKREEEERSERKKRLEDIMKRVKPDESKVSSPLSPITTGGLRGLENLSSPVSSLALQSMSGTEENLETVDLSDIKAVREALPAVAVVEQVAVSSATCASKEEVLTFASVAQLPGGESPGMQLVKLEPTGEGSSEKPATPEITGLLKDSKPLEDIHTKERIMEEAFEKDAESGEKFLMESEETVAGEIFEPVEEVKRSTENLNQEVFSLGKDSEAVEETSASLSLSHVLSQEPTQAEQLVTVEATPEHLLLGTEPSQAEQSSMLSHEASEVELSGIVQSLPEPFMLSEDLSQTEHFVSVASTPELASQLASSALSQRPVETEGLVVGVSTETPLPLIQGPTPLAKQSSLSESAVPLPLPSPDEPRVTSVSADVAIQQGSISGSGQGELPDTIELESTYQGHGEVVDSVTLNAVTGSTNNDLATRNGEITLTSVSVLSQEKPRQTEQAVAMESMHSSLPPHEQVHQQPSSSEPASACVQIDKELDQVDQAMISDSSIGSLRDEKFSRVEESVTREPTEAAPLFVPEPSHLEEHFTLPDLSLLSHEEPDQAEHSSGMASGSDELTLSEKSDQEKEGQRLETLLSFSSKHSSEEEQPKASESTLCSSPLSKAPGQTEQPMSLESDILTLSRDPNQEELRVASELVANALLLSLQPTLEEQGVVLKSASEVSSVSLQLTSEKQQLTSESSSRIDVLSQEPCQVERCVTSETIPSALPCSQDESAVSVSHPGHSTYAETIPAPSSVNDRFNLAEDLTLRLRIEDPGSPSRTRSETSSVDITRSADSSATDSVRSEESSTADATRSEEPGWGDVEGQSEEEEEEDGNEARQREEQFARLEIEADQAWVKEMESSGPPPELDEEETLKEDRRTYSVDDLGFPIKPFAGCDMARRKTQPAVHWEPKDHGHLHMKDSTLTEELEAGTDSLRSETEVGAFRPAEEPVDNRGLERYEEQSSHTTVFGHVLEKPETEPRELSGHVKKDVRVTATGHEELPLIGESESRHIGAYSEEKATRPEELLELDEEKPRVTDAKYEETPLQDVIKEKTADASDKEIQKQNEDEVRVTDAKHAEIMRTDDAEYEEILGQNEDKVRIRGETHEEIPRQDEDTAVITCEKREETFGHEDETRATTVRHEEISWHYEEKAKNDDDKTDERVRCAEKKREEIPRQDEGTAAVTCDKQQETFWHEDETRATSVRHEEMSWHEEEKVKNNYDKTDENVRRAEEKHKEIALQDEVKVPSHDGKFEEIHRQSEGQVCHENVKSAISVEQSSNLNIQSFDGEMQLEVAQHPENVAAVHARSSVSDIEPYTSKPVRGTAGCNSDKEVILSAEELLHRCDDMAEGPATTLPFNGSPIKVPHMASFESMRPMRHSEVFFDLSSRSDREHVRAEGDITSAASEVHEGQSGTSKAPSVPRGGVETYGLHGIPTEFSSDLIL